MSGAQGAVFPLFNTVPVMFVGIGQVGANRGLTCTGGQLYPSTMSSCLQNNSSNWYFNLYKHKLDFFGVKCNILSSHASYWKRSVCSRRREAWLAGLVTAAIIAERKNIHQKPSWRGMKPCNHLNKQTNKQTCYFPGRSPKKANPPGDWRSGKGGQRQNQQRDCQWAIFECTNRWEYTCENLPETGFEWKGKPQGMVNQLL